MKFKPKISKEEVAKLPVVTFGGTIEVIDRTNAVAAAIESLQNISLVGIDTESKPSFTRGENNKVALLQVATENKAFLFRLNLLGKDAKETIFNFLASAEVKKIGLSLRDDFARLHKLSNRRPDNFVDLQTIAHQYGILELGLQKMYAIIFGKRISKNQRLTNWEGGTLTEAQQRYAATDAWACLMIYNQLLQEKKITEQQLEQLLAEYPANPNQIKT